MRFKTKSQRKMAELLLENPKPATADGVQELASIILDACDEIDFHKVRRTSHDTLTLLTHEHTADCLKVYRKAFNDLLAYVQEGSDFRNGVTDPSSGVDEGSIKAISYFNELRMRVFEVETGRKKDDA